MQKGNQLKSCYKKGLSSPNTRPSSPRSVSMRGIGAAHTLYPAFAARRVGMTERVCRVARIANHGFTLIELLVVVLIIGILAAVALPQYNKAVMKSRYAALKTLTKSIADAQEIYYLANGVYATSFDGLAIETNGTPNATNTNQTYDRVNVCTIGTNYTQCYSYTIKMGYRIYWTNTTNAPQSRRLCVTGVGNENALQSQICKQETKATSPFAQAEMEVDWAYQ